MKKIALKLIDLYQRIKKDGKKHCRYIPSCSNYAKEAYTKFNFIKASFLTLFRILRCNPLFKGGFDPVPLTKKEKLELQKRLEKISKESFDPTVHLVV